MIFVGSSDAVAKIEAKVTGWSGEALMVSDFRVGEIFIRSGFELLGEFGFFNCVASSGTIIFTRSASVSASVPCCFAK